MGDFCAGQVILTEWQINLNIRWCHHTVNGYERAQWKKELNFFFLFPLESWTASLSTLTLFKEWKFDDIEQKKKPYHQWLHLVNGIFISHKHLCFKPFAGSDLIDRRPVMQITEKCSKVVAITHPTNLKQYSFVFIQHTWTLSNSSWCQNGVKRGIVFRINQL